MQSVRAGAVQTYFFMFTIFLKSRSSKTSFGLHFGDDFRLKCHTWVKKGAPKKYLKKVVQADSNTSLFQCPGAPGQLPQSQRLFEQETTIWARNSYLSKKQEQLLISSPFLSYWLDLFDCCYSFLFDFDLIHFLLIWLSTSDVKRSFSHGCPGGSLMIWHALG